MINDLKIIFFGSSAFSVFCLEKLKDIGIKPSLIITTPDMPTGRGLKLSPSPIKLWAQTNNIECQSPKNLKDLDLNLHVMPDSNTIFLVASYGKIIPKAILDLPKLGALNIHPSLLPKYRGPSPLQTQILNDELSTGVTVMLMDEKVDHGPIIVQKNIAMTNWPVKFHIFEKVMADEGGKLLAEILPDWIHGKIKAAEQNHSEATFTKKIKKEDGLIDVENGDPYKNFLKIQAYDVWPQAYFFISNNKKKIRVIIKDAKYTDGRLEITKVIPEGKKEMLFQDFLRGLK